MKCRLRKIVLPPSFLRVSLLNDRVQLRATFMLLLSLADEQLRKAMAR